MQHQLIDKYFRVLDHGFVALKDVMGDDEDIETSARVSYGKGTRKRSETRGLLRYLISHRHTSPLEMAVLKFHVRMPIYVHRQHIRHRMSSTNEYSGRYSLMLDATHKTDPTKWRSQSTTNKQGSGGYIGKKWPKSYIDVGVNQKLDTGEYLSEQEAEIQRLSRRAYEARLEFDVAREQARKDLPLSTYTEFYWKIDLHNLFHYMGLRSDKHAQEEIQVYSNLFAGIVKEVYPLAFEAWYDYAFEAPILSRLDRKFFAEISRKYSFTNMQDLREKFERSGDQSPITLLGMSKRELEAFWSKYDLPQERDFSLDINKAEPFEAFSLEAE